MLLNELIAQAFWPFVYTILGGFLVTTLRFGYRKADEARQRRKYPITGWYASKFKNRFPGADQMIVDKASVYVTRQRGFNFKGQTFALSYDRSWWLTGEISKNHSVFGEYGVNAPGDSCKGAFLLHDDGYGKGDFEGGWLGYTENRMVETGYYYWFRLLSIAVIEQPGDRDRQSAKSLMALEGEANNYDFDNGPQLGIAKHRDKVVGAVLFQHSAVDESDDQIAAWCPRALCKQLEGTACTVVCDLVVDARSRQRGVGTRLLLHVLQRANLAESRLLIGRPTTATAAVGVLEGIGFERWSESGPDEKTPFGMLVRPTPPMW